ncbi:MAG: VCBS repeat-containing protein [Candidatus Eisenbacteria bacterium]|nr:VCBS repeat-containing protein [Candidatus Eisenbacteria bacterium]
MRLRLFPALALAGLALLTPALALAGAFVPGPSTTHTVGTGPRAIATGDFNEDGRPDMAVGNEGASGVSVLLGLAGGGFAPAVLYNTGPVPGEIAVADFDRDGHLDFAVGHYNTDTVVIMRGTGTGTFTTGITLAGPPHPEGLVAADLNADGVVDLATCGYPTTTTGTASVWLNTGTPGGALSFGTRSDYAVGAWPNSIRAGVFANNNVGLVTANYNGASVTILDSDGAGHFTTRTDLPAPPHVYMAAVGYVFPSLSREQIVTANADSNSVSLYLYSEVAHAWERRDYPASSRPSYVAIADADADGTLDVVTSDYVSGQLSVFQPNHVTETFNPRVSVPTVTNPYAVAIADFDLDGKPDLAASNRSGNTVRVTRGAPRTGWGVGDTIPAFAASNQNGSLTRVARGSGKWLLLDQCSRWCQPCNAMAEHTQGVYLAWYGHPSVRFDYLTLLEDGRTAGVPSTLLDAQQWAYRYRINRPVLHSDGLAGNGAAGVALASDAISTPTLRLVDPNGVVRWVFVGAVTVDSTLIRIIANCAGVPVPAPMAQPKILAATQTFAYGASQVSVPIDTSAYYNFVSLAPPPAFGPGFSSHVNLSRDQYSGREFWHLEWVRWNPLTNEYLDLPTAQSWQFTISGLSIDLPSRTLPPGTQATFKIVQYDPVEEGYARLDVPLTAPVAWNGSTLTIGPIPAGAMTPYGSFIELDADFSMQFAMPVADVAPAAVTSFALRAPAPNPAAREARLSWTQPRAGDARLDVFDLSGRLVRTIERGAHAAGAHTATWNLADANDSPVGAGLYFARVAVAGEGTRTVRVTVVR